MLAAVCDGVGSLSDGAYASAFAIRKLSEWYEMKTTTKRIGIEMRDELIRINRYIVDQAKRNELQTASTVSAVLFVEDSYSIVHLGDSRIYSYNTRKKILSVHTKDDVSDSGRLLSYIGKTEDILFYYSEGQIEDDVFLLCSDGLYKKMDEDFLVSQLQKTRGEGLKKAIQSLVQYVVAKGEGDNISLALIKVKL